MTVEIILRRADGTVVIRNLIDAFAPFTWFYPVVGVGGVSEGNLLLKSYDYIPNVSLIAKKN